MGSYEHFVYCYTNLTYRYEIHYECSSTLTTLANVLFVEMLKLKNNNNLRIIFVKKNEKYFGMFFEILNF